MSTESLRQMIEEKALELGFDAIGFAPVDTLTRDRQRLTDFIDQGQYGDMDWMADTHARRLSPTALWPEVKTVIVLGTNYGPVSDPIADLQHKDRALISVYARNRDYHDDIKKRLKRLARWLVENAASDVKVFVDTAPVMEKPVAAMTQLGWQGKHTNIVSRTFGSWLFLGEVFTTLDLPKDRAEVDHCGSCTVCQTICPTDAFPGPYTLDARKCISYLTIEHKGPIPIEFRTAMGNRIYGCDDCLAVCPWNKFASRTEELAFLPRPELTAQKLVDYLDLDDHGFREVFRGSPIKRIGRDRFIRNVLIGVGNSALVEASSAVIPLLQDASPLVRGAAVWAVRQLCADQTVAELKSEHLPLEEDPQVVEEWERDHGQ